jgi:hypothetical protein
MRARLNSSFICLVATALVFMVLPWCAEACTISLANVQVFSDFRVVVQHGATPIPGIQVEVYDSSEAGSKPILSLLTGSDGAAEIHNLRTGAYMVNTKGPGAYGAVYAIVSTKLEKRENQISFEWPSPMFKVLKTRTLGGRLASNNPLTPFENIHAELWAAGGQEPLAVQDIGVDGHFQFRETKPGIYILRVRGQRKNARYGSQVEGDIPLELQKAKKKSQEPLSLYLGMSGCGITYDHCPVPSADALPTRRLQVYDPLGSIITYSEYRVLNHAGAEIAAGSTGSNGIVELPLELNGTATLIVTKTGSPIFELPLYLMPPTDTAEFLTVVMGIQGYGGDNCSAANLEKNATPE